jgi:recombinational DNA repair protein RecR
MKLRIGIVEKSEIDGVHKSTYIIMNFDLKEMISFQNAFCSKNGNIVECACCEHTEIDQMCKSFWDFK